MMRIGAAGALFTTLSACSGFQASNTESDFLCAARIGTPCATMAQADGRALGAGVASVAEAPTDLLSGQISQASLPGGKAGPGGTTPGAGAPDGGAPYRAANYRIPERLGTLWIAPRLDADGILHEATFVHFVVRDARWGS